MVTVNLVQAKAHPLEILRVAGVLVFAGNDEQPRVIRR
jgi:hypothetical protein